MHLVDMAGPNMVDMADDVGSSIRTASARNLSFSFFWFGSCLVCLSNFFCFEIFMHVFFGSLGSSVLASRCARCQLRHPGGRLYQTEAMNGPWMSSQSALLGGERRESGEFLSGCESTRNRRSATKMTFKGMAAGTKSILVRKD